MRFNRSSTSVTGRPKSKGRQAIDAVLFLAAAGVVSWSGFRHLNEGRILLRKRPPKGLLGGMDEVPSSPWREGSLDEGKALEDALRRLDPSIR